MASLKDRVQIATVIALLFHVSGIIAIGIYKSQDFIMLTPLNLLVSFGLILWTQGRITTGFISFLLLASLAGFFAEWIGVHTGRLFGNYSYGSVLGYKWQDVPLIIGLNWFITIYSIGVAMHMLQSKIRKRRSITGSVPGQRLMDVLLIFDGALLAVLFDWIIEPVATRLGYWSWKDGSIPMLNYWTWFAVSAVILLVFRISAFPKKNLFAVHLLLIQMMFFLLLRL